jgi:hypothetical protein
MKLVTKDGAEYALVKGGNIVDRLPKRYASEITVTLAGTPTKAPVTINRSWAGDSELTLSYPWFLVDGRAYYATLAPGESLDGVEAEIVDGAGPKPPKRVTVKVETEAARIARFKATWEARRVE